LCDAQINTYLRKAEKAIEKNKIEDAKNYYLSAYKIDKNNFEANLGLGFVLCEFMAKYTEAIPYLETAYYKDQTDTVADLYYSLAKCYNHHGKFTKAYELYQKLGLTY
jgi:tetratricopeptide (TPR) repeat protein